MIRNAKEEREKRREKRIEDSHDEDAKRAAQDKNGGMVDLIKSTDSSNLGGLVVIDVAATSEKKIRFAT